MRAIATLEYGPFLFSMELPPKVSPDAPGKTFFRASDLGLLEQSAALWVIEHGAVCPETIRALRAAAGLTATALADLLGVNKSRVSDWEGGKHDPGVAIWMTIADLALEKMKKRISARARLEAVKAFREKPVIGEIRLAVG